MSPYETEIGETFLRSRFSLNYGTERQDVKGTVWNGFQDVLRFRPSEGKGLLVAFLDDSFRVLSAFYQKGTDLLDVNPADIVGRAMATNACFVVFRQSLESLPEHWKVPIGFMEAMADIVRNLPDSCSVMDFCFTDGTESYYSVRRLYGILPMTDRGFAAMRRQIERLHIEAVRKYPAAFGEVS